VAGILQVKGSDLDKEYLWCWARELGVLDALERLWHT